MTLTPLSGKVRDRFDLGDGRMLLVATDRISVFDVVLDRPVADKGAVLTAMTEFWFTQVLQDIPNHFITTDMTGLPQEYFDLYPDLQGRGMIVKRARILPVECIVRGYLYGSVMKEYQTKGTVVGIAMQSGLVKASLIDPAIFTPSTKAEIGQHDENISFDEMLRMLGGEISLATKIRDLSLEIYRRGAEYARERGIIIADTKFEFGYDEATGDLILCDEVLTGDSSRFWELASWEPGSEPVSFDKQPVRDYYATNHPDWEKEAPAPPLPAAVAAATTERYVDGLITLTGKGLPARM